MKKLFLVIAALSLVLSMPSCGEKPAEPDPENQNEEQKEDLSGADILSFKLVKGEEAIEAAVSSFEKRVLIVYLPEQAPLLLDAVAEVTLSKGATISPNPAEPHDYDADIAYTVTSGDGTTTKTYVVGSEEAKVVNNVVKGWSKTYKALGIADQIFDQGQSQIGWCDLDKFVTHEGSVFDIEGNKLGSLNTEGISSSWGLISLANDDKGRFIATYGNGSKDRNMVDTNNAGAIYIWADGWNAKPTLLYEFTEDKVIGYPQYYWGASDCASLSASGDYAGDPIVNTLHFGDVAIEGIPTGLHNVMLFKNGKISERRVFDSRQRFGDGNWIQMISPASASLDGEFVIGDSNNTGVGYGVFVRREFENLGDDYPLLGGVEEIPGWDPEASYPGLYGYGNYSVGHVKAFNWFSTPAVIVTSTFWEGAFLTILPLDEELAPIHPTEVVSNIHEVRVSSAYVFNPADQIGYILINVGFNSGEVILYKLSRTAI